MLGPDPDDDTSADYEQFEKELVAQDRDADDVHSAAPIRPRLSGGHHGTLAEQVA